MHIKSSNKFRKWSAGNILPDHQTPSIPKNLRFSKPLWYKYRFLLVLHNVSPWETSPQQKFLNWILNKKVQINVRVISSSLCEPHYCLLFRLKKLPIKILAQFLALFFPSNLWGVQKQKWIKSIHSFNLVCFEFLLYRQ